MSQVAFTEPAALLAQLLDVPLAQRAAWFQQQPPRDDHALVATLKQQSDALLLSDPQRADELTQTALLVAHGASDPSSVLPLALWARGNWQAFHTPAQAITSYERALVSYRAVGDQISVGRLLTNLIGVYTDVGQFDRAEQAYNEARACLDQVGDDGLIYLLSLEGNRGYLLLDQHNRYSEALESFDRALELAERLDRADLIAEVRVNQAYTYAMLGRMSDAERTWLAARDVAAQYGDQVTIARIDVNLGEVYTAQGRPADALAALRAARTAFVTLANEMELGFVALREAEVCERLGAWRQAGRSYAVAEHTFTINALHGWAAMVLVRQAVVARRLGHVREVQQLLDAADQLWRDSPQTVWHLTVVYERCELALMQRQPAAALALLASVVPDAEQRVLRARHLVLSAEAYAQQRHDDELRQRAVDLFHAARDLAHQIGERWIERRALVGRGRLLHDPAMLEAAAAIDDDMRLALSVQELKASFQAERDDVLPLLARWAIDAGDVPRALQAMWRAKGSALVDLIAGASDPTTGDVDPNIAAFRQQLAARRWQLAQHGDRAQPQSDVERADAALQEDEQRLVELRRAHNRAWLLSDSMLQADPLALLRTTQADVLIEYLVCDDELLGVRLDADGAWHAARLGALNDVLDLLDELTLNFQNVLLHPNQRAQGSAAWLDECLPLLARAHTILLAPLGDLPPDSHVLVALCTPLHHVPFGALWSEEQFLIERHVLEWVPSGALLAVAPPQALLGPPLILASTVDGQLRAAAAEARAIHALLPAATCLIDTPQMIEQLAALPHPPRLLHLAAHLSPRDDAPIFAALHLPDGVLTVEQCFDLPLRGTQVAVLSGCSTASGLDSGGSVLAFQSALFVAGVHRVVSSLWQVDDTLTQTWMQTFYTHLLQGRSPAHALQQTQRALLTDPTLRHPAIWATWICSRR